MSRDQNNGQARLETFRIIQTPILNAVPAHQRVVIDLDPAGAGSRS